TKECWPSPDIEPGVPRGALTEISGPGKTEWAARFLAQNSGVPVAWVEEEFSVYPFGLLQKQVGLERVLFVESGEDSRWTVFQALRSQAFGVVLFSSTTTTTRSDTGPEFVRDERMLRGLQLAAEKSRASMIFLADQPGDSWPVSLQIQVSKDRGSGIRSHVLK